MTTFPVSARFVSLAVCGAWLSLTAACSSLPWEKSASSDKAFVPVNHTGEATIPASVRRVVLMPLAGGEIAPAASVADLDPVVTAALQLQNRFEVIAVSRDTCRRLFGVEELASVEALPADFMAVIRREFAADAVLFIDITVFRAYRPLEIGLRAKLATVQDVRLVWTFDNVFSAADPAVVNSARRQILTGGLPDIPADLSAAVVQSPSRFTAYAAEAMFATLPPLPSAPFPAAATARAKHAKAPVR
jgi:hypothetical protein